MYWTMTALIRRASGWLVTPYRVFFPRQPASDHCRSSIPLYLVSGVSLPHLPKDGLGTALYFNLLVLSQFARIPSSMIDEFGFDQFQKYTFVGVRESLSVATKLAFAN